jgi:diaminohydroxyphosphoribosylaminopyrimidine deaminase / 5-amino-6-(5-phosphoribosylamino)uracil reductase
MQAFSADDLFMQRALELAQLGMGAVSPNPLVGCVIVQDGKIIGEGRHEHYGHAHAEVNAVAAVKDKSELKNSTVYVNLEPCAHVGKTPPCADMLLQHHVKKVVIANVDTNPLVGGKGIEKLRAAGIEVVTGVREQEGRELNKRFFTFMEKKRPYIILKWAQTADGFIARENFDSKWISNEQSRQLVHKWRSEEDAVLVGSLTALHDNPALTVRDWVGRNPVRIVVDRNLKLPSSLQLFDGSVNTLCYNLHKTAHTQNLAFVKLPEKDFLKLLLNDLYERKIQSLMIEGGAVTLQNFVKVRLWDEARVFTAPMTFGTGIPAPKINGNIITQETVQNDTLEVYSNTHGNH